MLGEERVGNQPNAYPNLQLSHPGEGTPSMGHPFLILQTPIQVTRGSTYKKAPSTVLDTS
jgi:hypothetical protein